MPFWPESQEVRKEGFALEILLNFETVEADIYKINLSKLRVDLTSVAKGCGLTPSSHT